MTDRSGRSCTGPGRLLGNFVFLATIAGCGNGTRPEDIPDIDGAWNYSETVSLEQGTGSCNILGTLSLAQDFETFVGSFIRTVSCFGPKAPTRSESGSIPRGRVGKASIEFRIADCDYRGTITMRHPPRITGTTLCARTDAITVASGSSAGSWFAERLSDSTP